MSEGAPDFDTLRARGIALAQARSGGIWTDFNLHDPGVTLLEQFAFALTELGYRADFPVADLLTGPDGRLDLPRLGLAAPEAALGCRPVTPADLAHAIAGAEPSISRAIVAPRAGAETGLYDIHVIPDSEAEPGAALEAAHRRYHALRNLAEDAARVSLARCIPCRLRARVEIRRRHLPERVAARIYALCRRLMRDRAATEIRPPATRADAFADPAILFGHAGDSRGGAGAPDIFFAEIINLEEVEDIVSLEFRRCDAPDLDPFAPLEDGAYRELILPDEAKDVGLTLVSRDLPVPFDLAAMHTELARLRAEHIARLSETLDRADWTTPVAGRRRDFRHLPLGHGLPEAYGVGRSRLPQAASARARGETAQLRGFLGLGDALLGDAAEDLARLPDVISADLATRESYAARPLDFGPMPELAAEPAEETRARLAELDPWHARKGLVLDRLLALQGEEHSQNSLRQHDLYRSPGERRDAILRGRVRLLRAAARLNCNRAGGANILEGESGRFAPIARKLCILLDFPDPSSLPLGAPLTRTGLRLSTAGDATETSAIPRDLLPEPENPFDTLVPRRDIPEVFDRRELIARCGLLSGGSVDPRILRRGVAPEAYVLAPEADGAWRLFVDPGGEAPLPSAGRSASRPEAILLANRLRVFLTDLNRRSEGVHLVEDVLLRAGGAGLDPLTLTFVLPCWTARTHPSSFRRLAEETIGLICPAHLRPRVLWLDHAEMVAFEALELAWRVALRDDRRGGGTWGSDLAKASRALRDFLGARASA